MGLTSILEAFIIALVLWAEGILSILTRAFEQIAL